MSSSLTPRTEFIVHNQQYISEHDRTMLNDIYMPILGSVAVSIYIYLHDSSRKFKPLEIRMHSEIIDEMNMTLSMFSSELEKLEAVGLVKTYVNDDAHIDQLIYEVKQPLTAAEFFNDPMLSMFLYTKVGSELFNKKREYWKYPKLPDNITDVSRKFTEVFSNISLESFKLPDDHYEGKNHSTGSNVEQDDFDFEVLFTHLRGTFVDRKFFTQSVRENIVKLSELFHLNAYEMKKIIVKSTDKSKGIDLNILRRAALDYYRHEKEDEKVIPEDTPTNEDYFTSLDRISPVTRIRQLRNNNPSRSDELIVTRLVTETNLNNGVINVLLEYALMQKDGQLFDNYVFTIARDWESKGYQTAEEAKDAALAFYNNQSKNKSNYRVKRQIVEPKWFNDQTKESSNQKLHNKKVTKKQSTSIQEAIDRFRKL